jgi:hypothetical protein
MTGVDPIERIEYLSPQDSGQKVIGFIVIAIVSVIVY